MRTFILVAPMIALSFSTNSSAVEISVKPGDSLSLIAKDRLGSADRWVDICEINQNILRDCDLLPVGTVLTLPGGEGLSEASPQALTETEVTEEAASVLINGAFDQDISGWADSPDRDVAKTWVDGKLLMSRSGEGIVGAAQQSIQLQPGSSYELSVTVLSGAVGYLVDHSDRQYATLQPGERVVTVTPTEAETRIVFWPAVVGSKVEIDNVALRPLP